jgi:hypothetical protein
LKHPADAIVKVTDGDAQRHSAHRLRGRVLNGAGPSGSRRHRAAAAQDGGVGEIEAPAAHHHEFKFDEFLEAYETFGNASVDHALEVVLNAKG